MTKRLEQIYRMIPRNAKGIADIGTDHAIIPVALALSGCSACLTASDVASQPLQRAMETAERSGVRDRIRFVQCDGLDACKPEQTDCIVIAGMGGDTVCRILDRAEWIQEREVTLVLQPMTHAEVLRYWLLHNGFIITLEATVAEDRHLYQVFRAKNGSAPSLSDAEYLVGAFDSAREGVSLSDLCRAELLRIEKKLEGLYAAGQSDGAEALFYCGIQEELIKQLGAAAEV